MKLETCKENFKGPVSILLFSLPLIAFAAPADLAGFVSIFLDILNMLVPIIIGITLIAFFWGIIKFMSAGGDTENIREGRNMMIYGTLGLFVAVSVWGLVWVLVNTFFPTLLPSPPNSAINTYTVDEKTGEQRSRCPDPSQIC